MRADVVSFTRAGGELGGKISSGLREKGYLTQAHSGFESVMELVSGLFPITNALVFVGACGIAVRSVAPHLKGKLKDPAVIVCDEAGKFVISLLSGHAGGANALAAEIAAHIGAVPVITTATDARGVFAADSWAVKTGLYIENPEAVKSVSGALLEGEEVGFDSESGYSGKLPEGLTETAEGRVGIYVGEKRGYSAYETTLVLRPRNLTVGLGCRRGASLEALRDAVDRVLGDNGLETEAIRQLCSIDLKAGEPGIGELSRELKAPAVFYGARELSELEGDFEESGFVESVTGVGNVCERAAVLGGGKGELTVKKTAVGGVTVAVFKSEVVVSFDG